MLACAESPRWPLGRPDEHGRHPHEPGAQRAKPPSQRVCTTRASQLYLLNRIQSQQTREPGVMHAKSPPHDSSRPTATDTRARHSIRYAYHPRDNARNPSGRYHHHSSHHSTHRAVLVRVRVRVRVRVCRPLCVRSFYLSSQNQIESAGKDASAFCLPLALRRRVPGRASVRLAESGNFAGEQHGHGRHHRTRRDGIMP